MSTSTTIKAGFFALLLCTSLTASVSTQKSASISTQSDALALLIDANVAFLNLNFFDLFGKPHSYTITAKQAQTAFESGIIFDGSSIAGYNDITSSDLMIKPDLRTLKVLPWTTGSTKTASVICDVVNSDGSICNACPRTLLRSLSEQYKKSHGYQLLISPEIEFFLLPESCIDQKKFFIDSSTLDEQGYCSRAITDATFTLKQEILSALDKLGMNPEKFHHEVAPCQHEITLRCCPALQMADQLLMAKNIIAFIAKKHGFRAVYMPKPLPNVNGSGMHINYSLYRPSDQTNIFYDEKGSHKLSLVAQQFIAGTLAVMREGAALFNASINSYKRLVKGFEAPVFIAWGAKNRTALIRIPQATNSKTVRAELRSGDLLTNPYLLFSVLFSAGMSGVENGTILAPEAQTNLYNMSNTQRKALGIEELPSNLDQALKLFKESNSMKTILGKTIFNKFVAGKQAEVDSFNTAVTNWELSEYLNA